ncbi:hypothetical protein [Flavobacterium collinsii]|uniref:Uncharacterized protein n=1 Tax=Flavobacterium collinsii TaxID=1114861 RepID=A0ABM8KK05_9FLAO|nr:hypothetical protein [Flavobacterium collinsii]CAA9199459.1 hypothetical protein FLACOL7796_02737 [Flavobacterium collinsii]
MESIEKSNGIQLHYYFDDDSHSINSIVRNECEKEILYIIKEISETLGLQLDLETLPSNEGGFKEKWKLLGKNSTQISLIVAIALGVLSRFPVENEELTTLQIENLKLDNEIKRKELKKLNLDQLKEDSELDQKTVLDSVNIVNKNYKVSWRKSNLYKRLQNYSKVEYIDVLRLQDDEPVGTPRTVQKNQFSMFILRTDDLPKLELERVVIDVATPAIKRNFRWKGFYNEKIINFLMNDNDFNNKVFNGKMHFSNRYSIEVEMTQERKINSEGDIIVKDSIVNKVFASIDGESRIEY